MADNKNETKPGEEEIKGKKRKKKKKEPLIIIPKKADSLEPQYKGDVDKRDRQPSVMIPIIPPDKETQNGLKSKLNGNGLNANLNGNGLKPRINSDPESGARGGCP